MCSAHWSELYNLLFCSWKSGFSALFVDMLIFQSLLQVVKYFMSVMKMMDCFCGMVDRRKVFSLISSRDHSQRSSSSRVLKTLQAGFEPAQNLSSGLVEWSCTVVIIICQSINRSFNHITYSLLYIHFWKQPIGHFLQNV